MYPCPIWTPCTPDTAHLCFETRRIKWLRSLTRHLCQSLSKQWAHSLPWHFPSSVCVCGGANLRVANKTATYLITGVKRLWRRQKSRTPWKRQERLSFLYWSLSENEARRLRSSPWIWRRACHSWGGRCRRRSGSGTGRAQAWTGICLWLKHQDMIEILDVEKAESSKKAQTSHGWSDKTPLLLL